MSRPPRAASFAYRGTHRYFLTFCCRSREPVFRDARKAKDALRQFRRSARDESFEILAYCLMPDHAHLLVEGLSDEADLRRFAKLAKQRSGSSYAMETGRPLWQEGYFDRILREGDDPRAVIRYVFENPVRSRIVARVEEYPYLGSDRWTVAEILASCWS